MIRAGRPMPPRRARGGSDSAAAVPQVPAVAPPTSVWLEPAGGPRLTGHALRLTTADEPHLGGAAPLARRQVAVDELVVVDAHGAIVATPLRHLAWSHSQARRAEPLGHVHLMCPGCRRRDWVAVFAHAFEVKLDCLADQHFDLAAGRSCRDADQGDRARRPNSHCPPSQRQPRTACSSLRWVASRLFEDTPPIGGARSLLGRPAIVTRPGRVGCRYCRWLPRVRTQVQPSASTRRMASRTLGTAPRSR